MGKCGVRILMFLGMLLFSVIPGRALARDVSPSSVTGTEGSSVIVSINVDDATGIETFDMKLTFDPAYLTLDTTICSQDVDGEIIGGICNSTLTQDLLFLIGRETTPGVISIGGGGLTSLSGSGSLCDVYFTVKTGIVDCEDITSSLSMSNLKSDLEGSTTTAGTLTVSGDRTITLTAPNGGEYISGTVTITWTTGGSWEAGDTVDFSSSMDGLDGPYEDIVEPEITYPVAYDAGSLNVVPVEPIDGTNEAIKVQKTGCAGISDTSNAVFTIDNTDPTNVGTYDPVDDVVNPDSLLTALTALDATSGLHDTAYYFELDTDTGFTTGTQNSGWQAGNSWDPNLSADTTYYWRVKVKDKAGNESALCGPVADIAGYATFTTSDDRVINIIAPIEEDCWSGTQNIQWGYSGSSWASNDKVDVGCAHTIGSEDYDDIATDVAYNAGSASLDTTLFADGTEHTIRVQSPGGAPKDIVVFSIDNTDPTNVGTSSPSDGATGVSTDATLTALTASDVTCGIGEYYIQLATNSGFTTGVQNSGWLGTISWRPSLTGGTIYYWRVKARDNAGNETEYMGTISDLAGYATFTTAEETTTSDDSWNEKLGCFIATASFGTPLAKEVIILSEFRDEYLMTNMYGQKAVSFYYRYGPYVADYISDKEGIKSIVRQILKPIVNASNKIIKRKVE